VTELKNSRKGRRRRTERKLVLNAKNDLGRVPSARSKKGQTRADVVHRRTVRGKRRAKKKKGKGVSAARNKKPRNQHVQKTNRVFPSTGEGDREEKTLVFAASDERGRKYTP